ncbi:AAA domain-containing protein [Streptomyces sp. NPDC127118]|uniref:AAA domain-containing protein n=1 Tax=Streptomyces sp. NPDC127118 TaxID=3345369 RepID=UPI003636C428
MPCAAQWPPGRGRLGLSRQADLTHDWLADQGSLHRSPPVEVGTAHRFQGREFDVVVLDLVEDGRTLGRTGLGDLGSDRDFARTGARLFNVGATRARRRVYIVAAWSAVSRAATGTVLAHVRELATPGPDRRILGVRAAHLLGMCDDSCATPMPSPPPMPPGAFPNCRRE